MEEKEGKEEERRRGEKEKREEKERERWIGFKEGRGGKGEEERGNNSIALGLISKLLHIAKENKQS